MVGAQRTPLSFEGCPQKLARLHIATPVNTATKDDLLELAAFIKWECMQQWTKMYNTAQQHNLEPAFAHVPKAKDIFFQAEGVKGDSQRNTALHAIKQGLVYFVVKRVDVGVKQDANADGVVNLELATSTDGILQIITTRWCTLISGQSSQA